MDKGKLLQDLKLKEELQPDLYDGSYELMRETIAAYATKEDYSDISYLDLNAIYLMAVGTWKINVEKKKERIFQSSLADEQKERLAGENGVIDQIWDNACHKKYENVAHPPKPSIGMFGTGFYSFENKTTDDCAKAFVEMCVDIVQISEDNTEAIFDRVEKVLKNNFKGMKAASASVILHCLMPKVFPILNGNMGNDNIFVALGIDLEKPTEIYTYISNCRKIRDFRDANLPFKNYRILDMMAWELDKYETDEYIPSLEEYDPGITSDQYVELLQNEMVVKKSSLDTIYLLYLCGGEATCKQLERKYGESSAHYNANGIVTAKAIQLATNCSLSQREEGGDRLWAVLFQGRDAKADEDGEFVWRLRKPLSEAIAELDEAGFFEGLTVRKKEEFDHNIILYGPPGTGKTYNTIVYAVAIVEKKKLKDVQDEAKKDYKTVKERYELYKKAGQIAFTTFHQSYGYEEFIEGIRPVLDANGNSDQTKGEIRYEIKAGAFKDFCDTARLTVETGNNIDELEKNYVFIIDEINRGNISKIFGELITLIETTKRLGLDEEVKVRLPYSGNEFGVPANVYILGTMNTADRSIALMDTALRRRFSFIEMMPKSEVLADLNVGSIKVNSKILNVVEMLDVINKRIEFLYDREHTIGHAFFTDLKDNATLEKLSEIFQKNVIPLLQEYFYEDYEKIQLVLGDNKKSSDDYKFIIRKEESANSIFNGNPELDSMYTYSLNKEAFKHIESYIEICGGVDTE